MLTAEAEPADLDAYRLRPRHVQITGNGWTDEAVRAVTKGRVCHDLDRVAIGAGLLIACLMLFFPTTLRFFLRFLFRLLLLLQVLLPVLLCCSW